MTDAFATPAPRQGPFPRLGAACASIPSTSSFTVFILFDCISIVFNAKKSRWGRQSRVQAHLPHRDIVSPRIEGRRTALHGAATSARRSATDEPRSSAAVGVDVVRIIEESTASLQQNAHASRSTRSRRALTHERYRRPRSMIRLVRSYGPTSAARDTAGRTGRRSRLLRSWVRVRNSCFRCSPRPFAELARYRDPAARIV